MIVDIDKYFMKPEKIIIARVAKNHAISSTILPFRFEQCSILFLTSHDDFCQFFKICLMLSFGGFFAFLYFSISVLLPAYLPPRDELCTCATILLKKYLLVTINS